jgi:glycosyltransferase involved in cell wall biosynthesis
MCGAKTVEETEKTLVMKFSIIVVALNPGEKLGQTLGSIFAQTFTDYEVILKDGGSSDGSVDMWRKFTQVQTDVDGGICAGTSKAAHTEENRMGTPGMREDACRGEKAFGGRKTAEDIYGAEAASRVRYFEEPDKGIYDAMNQAVCHVQGDYILFLNCGDLFADEHVLERTADAIADSAKTAGEKTDRGIGEDGASSQDIRKETNACGRLVAYGDTLGEKNHVRIASPPKITGFVCYRNIPCHQSCFYSADLCREKPFDQNYRIRADYDHFLWCYYEAGAKMLSLGFPVSSYEGGGYSESRENRERDKEEHRVITARYIPAGKLLLYRLLMALSLAPLRSFLAENKAFSGMYHRIKSIFYHASKN